jgi:hypothetical protein
MIFGSLGLLIAAGGLLVAGITKSSTGLLGLSFACTVVAAILLIAAYAAARAGLTAGAVVGPGGTLPGVAPGAGAGAPLVPVGAVPPGTQPVVMYVPMAGAPQPGAPAAGAVITQTNGAAPPFLGYDEMTAEQVVKLVASGALTEGQIIAVHEYEASHAARKTVLDRLQRAT